MFGLITGTLCLVGLFAVVKRRHHYRFADYYGYHSDYHHGHRRGCHGHHHGHHHGEHAPWDEPRMGGRGSFRRRLNPLHYVFAELDTTPGQEKAIMKALEALREAKGALREELLGARKELARLFAAENFDAPAIEALFTRQQENLAKSAQLLRDFVSAMHETLAPEQRRKLSAFLVDGSLLYGFGGQHRYSY